MSLKWVAVAIALLGLAVAGYGTWMQTHLPQQTLSVGTVEIIDPLRTDGAHTRLLTRKVATGGVTLDQVELPNGTWIDCGGGCAMAARSATVDFWEEQQKKKK